MKLTFELLFIKCKWRYSLIHFLCVIGLMLFAIPQVSKELLANTDVYTVSGVEVDVTATSSAQARNKAFELGQRKALKIMYDRLVIEEDIASLTIDVSGVQELISSFEVIDEKVTPTRYRAKLTVAFSPQELRAYLRKKLVRFAESQSEGILVVPIFLKDSYTVPWSLENPWSTAWVSLKDNVSLLPVNLPLGDIEDFHEIKGFYNINTPVEKVRAFSRRYGLKKILIAIMDFSQLGAHDLDNLISEVFKLKSNKLKSDSSEDLKNNIGAETLSAFPEGIVEVKLRYVDLNSDNITHFTRRSDGSKNTNTFLSNIVKEVISPYLEQWKNSNLLRFDQENELHVSVPVDANINNWLSIRQRLNALPVVTNINIIELSLKELTIKLTYLGEIDQLAESLNGKKLELSVDEFGWKITPYIGMREIR